MSWNYEKMQLFIEIVENVSSGKDHFGATSSSLFRYGESYISHFGQLSFFPFIRALFSSKQALKKYLAKNLDPDFYSKAN